MNQPQDEWGWGPAWRKLRDDVNVLAWLHAELRWHHEWLYRRIQVEMLGGKMEESLEPWLGKARRQG